ncbi:putative holin-like toxin [Virgibacillus ainsalahensis]
MTVFESLVLMITFGTLIVAILSNLENLGFRQALVAKGPSCTYAERKVYAFLTAKKSNHPMSLASI